MAATPEIRAIVERHRGLTDLEHIRTGGQKSVWRVKYKDTWYALKIIRAEREAVERAKREIGIMRECHSPHLVSLGPLELQDIDSEGKRLIYYLEEFIDGLPLDQVPKPMALATCKALGQQLADAISALWSTGYVHRDIKPGNIMLRSDGQHFVLLDVGLAMDLSASSLTAPGNVVGTPLYLSPDQIRLAKRQLDFRSDLHALGVCMYECITGKHPLWNPEVPRIDLRDNILNLIPLPLTRFRAGISEPLQDIVLRLLEKEANMRYARIEHFIEELDGVVLP